MTSALFIPELGQLAMILALCFAVVQAIVPLLGAWRGDRLWMSLAQPAAWGQFAFLAFAFGCLTYAFMTDDFSVAYVANNSNSALPWYYKFSAVWGAHEGSLLLWALILGGWTFAVSVFSRQLPQVMLARVLAVMGMISIGFLLFLIMTSNPFTRILPQIPVDGHDLNPLLQDIGLIVHPPMLYMGYVGFSVAFAFAIAALLGGRLDAAWARWSRPWTIVAWAFLGIGITLGSWWAYYELGWGGWWFWDPVENASFMPWLVGTALIHSLAVTEKRGVFKSWTVLLAIAAFSLSLLGTFLVRSGVLTSVHAFASDPERGVFILIFLLFVVGGSLTLFALRAPVVKSQVGFNLWSRETLLLGNNLVLVVAASMILLGTLYPLVLDALSGAKLSVGPPYFNALFIPLMGLLMVVMAVGVLVRWKDTPVKWLAGMLMPVLLGSVALAVIAGFAYGDLNWAVLATSRRATWVSAGRRAWTASNKHPPQRPNQRPAQPDPQLWGHADRPHRHRRVRPGRGVVQPEQRRARPAPGAGRVHGPGRLPLHFRRRQTLRRAELYLRQRHRTRRAQRQGNRRAAPGKTPVHRAELDDDRSRHRRRFHPRPVCGVGRTLGRRRLGRASARQNVRTLDLVRRLAHRFRWFAGRAGPALSGQGQESGA